MTTDAGGEKQEITANRLTMHGQTAELRVGHEVAVCLGRWELTRSAGSFVLTAPVIHRNLYWLTAGYPIDLCLTLGRQVWRWRDVLISGDDPVSVTGQGRPEIRGD
jgi:hypothetical protein